MFATESEFAIISPTSVPGRCRQQEKKVVFPENLLVLFCFHGDMLVEEMVAEGNSHYWHLNICNIYRIWRLKKIQLTFIIG